MPHFFPIPGAHLDCVVTCFTCLLVLAFIGWAVFGNGQVEWKVFRNFRLNIVSLDFSPGGTYYLHRPRPIGLAFRHRMGRFFTRNPHTWLPISTKIKHAPVSPIFFLSNTVRRSISESQLSQESPIIRPWKWEMWLTKVDLLFTILNKT